MSVAVKMEHNDLSESDMGQIVKARQLDWSINNTKLCNSVTHVENKSLDHEYDHVYDRVYNFQVC